MLEGPRSLPGHLAADDDPHDLVCALEDAVHPQVADVPLDGVVSEVSASAHPAADH